MPACHGHGDEEPAGDEDRAHIWTVAGEEEAEAQGTLVSEDVEGQNERLCISRLSLHVSLTKLLSRRGEAMPGCEHLC